MNFPRMSLSQFFKKQSAGEIEIETEETTVDPTTPEAVLEPSSEESVTVTEETVADPVAETTDPTNGDIVVDDTVTTEASADGSGSGEGSANHQAIVQAITTELNLFGATPEARTAFRTEAARNKGFIEAMKNVGVISDEDTTTAVQVESGLKSYEAAPWNKKAMEKRK